MNCREVKQLLALHVGHDHGDVDALRSAREHLTGCIPCRVHAQRLKSALAQLQQVDAESTYEVRGSMWPELETRLNQRSVRVAPRQNWLPVVSVAAACLLAISFWTSSPPANLHDPAAGMRARQMMHPLPPLNREIRSEGGASSQGVSAPDRLPASMP